MVAAGRGERGEPDDRLRLRVEVRELRADVHVKPQYGELTGQGVLDQLSRLSGWKPELRAVVPGPDRLVGVGVDAERDPNEHALDSGFGGERGLVGCVEDDGCAFGGCFAEKRAVLVVPVPDDLLAAVARRPRERQLTGRCDIDTDSLLTQEAQHGDVRERLRPEGDVASATAPFNALCAVAERLLAVDEERRAELGGEGGRGQPTERRGQLPSIPAELGNRSSRLALGRPAPSTPLQRPRCSRWLISSSESGS